MQFSKKMFRDSHDMLKWKGNNFNDISDVGFHQKLLLWHFPFNVCQKDFNAIEMLLALFAVNQCYPRSCCYEGYSPETHLNTLTPRQNGRHFAYDIFHSIFLNENSHISIELSVNFVPSVQLTLFNHWFRYWLDASNYRKQWCNVLLTHICVTRLQWVSNSNLTKSHSLITSVSVPTEHACAFCIANIRSSVRFHSRSQHVWWCNLAAKGATASL